MSHRVESVACGDIKPLTAPPSGRGR